MGRVSPMPLRQQQLLEGLALYLILLGAAFALWHGTTGAFLFDDYSNLDGLDRLVADADAGSGALIQFLAEGFSSPLGRPLSLVTFALQMHDWPSSPAGFIRCNILLHLLNGALLFWALKRLVPLMALPEAALRVVPLATVALWLLAPIQVTSVLYIVQRMAELAGTFVFLGLLMYAVGRGALLQGRARAGLAWMSAGLALGAGVGTLAKENAALLPLLIGTLELTVLAHLPRPPVWRRWALVFLALPAAALAAYLLYAAWNASGFLGRDFTLGQRLLTEPRILFLYLYKLLMPWPSGMRLWYDDLTISTSLLEPWTTLPAVLAWAGLLVLAFAVRRRAPLVALPILWFISAHLLESTVLPLELAFDHRNYVASAGVWLAVAAGGLWLWTRASGAPVQRTGAALAGLYVALLAAVTWQIASLWGNPVALTVRTAAAMPGSKRAQHELIGAAMKAGNGELAARMAATAAAHWPDDAAFPLKLAEMSCQTPTVAHPDFDDVRRRIAGARARVIDIIGAIDKVLSLLETNHCPIGLPVALSTLTGAVLDNRQLHGGQQNRFLLHSRALALENRAAEAEQAYLRAVDVDPKMILLIHGALRRVDAGDFPGAREYLRRAERDPRVDARERWAYRDNIRALRDAIESRERAAAGS